MEETSEGMQTLPPLILHPFASTTKPEKLIESSRASLMLYGLVPDEGQSAEQLQAKILEGRYAEFRMLYYIGRDINRWIEQCCEVTGTGEGGEEILPQSFASLLVDATPARAGEKLRRWGVSDYRNIFVRAVGLNVLFSELPPRPCLSDEFLRRYYRYAEKMFAAWRDGVTYCSLIGRGYDFELYASAEYSKILEEAWKD